MITRVHLQSGISYGFTSPNIHTENSNSFMYLIFQVSTKLVTYVGIPWVNQDCPRYTATRMALYPLVSPCVPC